MPVFTLGVVDDLVAQLAGAGVPADRDPATVPVPGVWVQVAGIRADDLAGGLLVDTRLVLIAANNGYTRAQDDLLALLGQVVDVVGLPDPGAVPGVVNLPNQTGDLPALTLSIPLYTEGT